jgi:hypothetical protein
MEIARYSQWPYGGRPGRGLAGAGVQSKRIEELTSDPSEEKEVQLSLDRPSASIPPHTQHDVAVPDLRDGFDCGELLFCHGGIWYDCADEWIDNSVHIHRFRIRVSIIEIAHNCPRRGSSIRESYFL